MNGSSTYRAVLYGPNVIAAGTEMDLDYVNGEYQDIVVIEAVEGDETIVRSYRKGKETEAPLLEAFDVGLFTAEPGRKTFTKDKVILFEKRPIRSGKQELRFVVDKAPTHVGVDPYNKRIDRNSDDNVIKVG